MLCQAAEKLQENGAVRDEDQPATVSASAASVTSSSTVTTTGSSTVAVSVESQRDTHSKKATCSQNGTELSVHKSNALASALAVTAADQSRCHSGPGVTHPPLKPSSELRVRDKPGAEKTKTAQQHVSSFSSRTTDTSPQISTKMAKSRRGQKIGQPPEVANSAPQIAGQKTAKQPVATSSCRSSLPAGGVASRCAAHSGGIHASSTTSARAETSSAVVAHLSNGLVAPAGKACNKVDHLSQTETTAQHGRPAKPPSHLPNGLHVHADRSPAKTSLLAQNGSDRQHGSKHGTEATNGPSSSSVNKKTLRMTDVVAVEENGHARASKSSETIVQPSSVIDMSLQVNGHTDQVTTGTAAKGKKARRKGRGKEALTSVG